MRGGLRAAYKNKPLSERKKDLKKKGAAGDAARHVHGERARFKEQEEAGRRALALGLLASGRRLSDDQVKSSGAMLRGRAGRETRLRTNTLLRNALADTASAAFVHKIKRVEKDLGPLDDVRKGINNAARGLLYANPVTAPITFAVDKKSRRYVTSGKASADARKVGGKVAKALDVGGGQTAGLPAGSSIKEAADGNPRKWGKRAVEDLVAFPTDAVASTATTVSALNQARKGNTAPAKQLLKEVQEGDPSYALLSAAVNTATGDFKGAKSDIKRFGVIADQHPGLTALSVAGTKGAIGRGGGRVVRGAGMVTRSQKLKSVGSTKNRPNATVPGTEIEARRDYSPDIITKGAQVLKDKHQSKRAAKLRQRADEAAQRGDQQQANALRKRAAEKDPTRARAKDMYRQVDRTEFIGEEVRRRNVADAEKRVDATQKGVSPDDLAANITITRGITDNNLDDLRAYRNELKAVYKDLPADKKAANQQLRDALDRTIEAPDAPKRIQALTEAAKRYSADVDQPLDKRLADLGIIDPKRAEKAKLAATVFREGAEVSDKVVPTEAGLIAKATKKANKQAQAALQDALARYAPEQGQAMRDSGRRVVTEDSRVIADELEAAAKRQEDSGRFAFGKGNAKHLRRQAEEMRARADVEPTTGDPIMAILDAQRVADDAKAAAKAAKLDGRKGKAKTGLVDAQGRKITLTDLREKVADREVPPSYLSLAPGRSGDHFTTTGREPRISGQKLRGRSIKEGTIPIDEEMMTRRAVKAEGLATAAEQYRRNLSEAAVRGEDGKVIPDSREAAQAKARELTAETGTEYTAVRFNPLGSSRKQFESILDDLDNADVDPRSMKGKLDEEGERQPSLGDLLKEGWEGRGDGDFVVVPKAIADRQLAHLSRLGMGDAEKALRAARTTWSRSILGTAPSVPISNLVESSGRAVIAGSGPVSYLRARRAINALSPAERARVEAGLLGGTRIDFSTRTRHTDPSQFDEGNLQNIAKGVEELRRMPVSKQAFKAWDIWTQVWFNYMQRVPERHIRTAHLGRSMKQLGLFDDSITGLTSRAAKDAADGLGATPNIVALARMIDDKHGQYGAFPPAAQYYLSNYTPFAAWLYNSANFVYHILPRDHPLATSMLVAMELATEQAREGQDKPPWETGNVGRWRVGHNTPFAIGENPAKTAGSMVLPQLSPLIAALGRGEDWKGDKLEHEDGRAYTEAEKITYGIWETMRAAIPAIHAPEQAVKYAKDPEKLTRSVRSSKPSAWSKQGQRVFKIEERMKTIRNDAKKQWKDPKTRPPRGWYGTHQREADRLLKEQRELKKEIDRLKGVKPVAKKRRPSTGLGGGLGGGSLGGGL